MGFPVSLPSFVSTRYKLENLDICLPIPADVFVHGHRYNIIDGLGCYRATHNTTLAYPLTYAPPIASSLVSSGYVICAIYHFIRYRKEFNSFLGSSTSTFTSDRYKRLMLFSSFETLLILPLSVYELYMATYLSPVQPYISWADTHSDWNRVDLHPLIFMKVVPRIWINLTLVSWSIPFAGVAFFGFFGLGERQRTAYKQLWHGFARAVCLTKGSHSTYGPGSLSVIGLRAYMLTVLSLPGALEITLSISPFPSSPSPSSPSSPSGNKPKALLANSKSSTSQLLGDCPRIPHIPPPGPFAMDPFILPMHSPPVANRGEYTVTTPAALFL